MMTYTCGMCGYIFDEAEGYSDGEIPMGTKWEDIGDDFVCPLCGANKYVFSAE